MMGRGGSPLGRVRLRILVWARIWLGPTSRLGRRRSGPLGLLMSLGPIRPRPLLASLGRLILGCRMIMGGPQISFLEGLCWASEARPRLWIWTWTKPNWGGGRPLNWSSPSSLGGPDQSRSFLWVVDGLWRPLAETQSLEENSKTDDALMEEASRYGNAS